MFVNFYMIDYSYLKNFGQLFFVLLIFRKTIVMFEYYYAFAILIKLHIIDFYAF